MSTYSFTKGNCTEEKLIEINKIALSCDILRYDGRQMLRKSPVRSAPYFVEVDYSFLVYNDLAGLVHPQSILGQGKQGQGKPRT